MGVYVRDIISMYTYNNDIYPYKMVLVEVNTESVFVVRCIGDQCNVEVFVATRRCGVTTMNTAHGLDVSALSLMCLKQNRHR